MPHTKSAKKRLRQNFRRRARNRARKRDIKEHIKQLRAAVDAGDAEQMQTLCRLAIKKLDKAAAKRVLHPNIVARKKSQLMKLVNAKTSPSS